MSLEVFLQFVDDLEGVSNKLKSEFRMSLFSKSQSLTDFEQTTDIFLPILQCIVLSGIFTRIFLQKPIEVEP